MIKNAFDATQPPEQILVRFEEHDHAGCFIVRNPGEIPEAVALQIFKRSFSTKSPHGKGLGTYSMKLFGERYLGGTVSFVTHEVDGTSFYISLPCSQ
jgi:sensor histidine kinase regulating citrate/malate metabolism